MNKIATIKEHWEHPENYEASWDERALIASQMLGGANVICEIGCGPRMRLKSLIGDKVAYLPSDLTKWTDDVATCDLASGKFPVGDMVRSDACVMLGVLEYLPNIESTFSMLGRYCDRIVFSYCSTDVSPDRWWLWINTYSSSDIIKLADSGGFTVTMKVAYHPGQFVFSAVNRRRSAAFRRAVASRLFRRTR